jgi:hypothetical protein
MVLDTPVKIPVASTRVCISTLALYLPYLHLYYSIRYKSGRPHLHHAPARRSLALSARPRCARPRQHRDSLPQPPPSPPLGLCPILQYRAPPPARPASLPPSASPSQLSPLKRAASPAPTRLCRPPCHPSAGSHAHLLDCAKPPRRHR